jgi:carbonic anhydrase/acetyltransferase-like protein (isoleucine patch superfamily)
VGIYTLSGVRPTLGRGVFVADSAAVIGDVHLGDGASVWFGAVVRGDYYPIRIGARTNVQDNVVVHITAGKAATTIGDEVTVGHSAVIHGCTIGSRVLVGMGSVVLDGAVVGDESFIAAGSLVTPRTVIPPRSFVLGRPAKVVRPVRAEELQGIHDGHTLYAGYARDFLAGLVRVE